VSHHNRTPQSVLDAPPRSREVVTPPTQQVSMGTGDQQRWYTGRAAVRRIRRVVQAERRGEIRTERKAVVLLPAASQFEGKQFSGDARLRLREKVAERKAKQGEFRARQAASVWPDGNRRSLSKTARTTR
jgi:hypothetical protein